MPSLAAFSAVSTSSAIGCKSTMKFDTLERRTRLQSTYQIAMAWCWQAPLEVELETTGQVAVQLRCISRLRTGPSAGSCSTADTKAGSILLVRLQVGQRRHVALHIRPTMRKSGYSVLQIFM
jgi:hypothetical protein